MVNKCSRITFKASTAERERERVQSLSTIIVVRKTNHKSMAAGRSDPMQALAID